MRNQNPVSFTEFKNILQEIGIAVPEQEAHRLRQVVNKALGLVGSKIHLDKY
jgi:Ca2+-binding EF-hand superfamily protein